VLGLALQMGQNRRWSSPDLRDPEWLASEISRGLVAAPRGSPLKPCFSGPQWAEPWQESRSASNPSHHARRASNPPVRSPKKGARKLTPHALCRLRSRIKGAAYVGPQGRQLEELLDRADREGSGWLKDGEFRKALRCTLKIPPGVFTDDDIACLFSMLDFDHSGRVGVREFLDFVEGEEDAFPQRINKAYRAIPDSVDNDAWTGGQRWRSQGEVVKSGPSFMRGATWPKKEIEKKKAAFLAPDVFERVRSRLKGAAYTGHFGMQVDVLFRRFDKDGSGELDESEIRTAMRRTLKIPSTVIIDDEITALVAELSDGTESGMVDIDHLKNFITDGSRRPTRMNRAFKSVSGEQAPSPRPAHEPYKDKQASAGMSTAKWPQKNGPSKFELHPNTIERLRAKIRASSYGQELSVIAKRYACESKFKDEAALRKLLRCGLKIPATIISDEGIAALFALLPTTGDPPSVRVCAFLTWTVGASLGKPQSPRCSPDRGSTTSTCAPNSPALRSSCGSPQRTSFSSPGGSERSPSKRISPSKVNFSPASPSHCASPAIIEDENRRATVAAAIASVPRLSLGNAEAFRPPPRRAAKV